MISRQAWVPTAIPSGQAQQHGDEGERRRLDGPDGADLARRPNPSAFSTASSWRWRRLPVIRACTTVASASAAMSPARTQGRARTRSMLTISGAAPGSATVPPKSARSEATPSS